ncbi:MAG TPA: hypothetical protein VL178_12035, partial [Pseudomonas sp.]|nr:hypothetical protein [Pseudomonas sp.]
GDKPWENRHVGNPAFHPRLIPSSPTAKTGVFRWLVPRATPCRMGAGEAYPQKNARSIHNYKNNLFKKMLFSILSSSRGWPEIDLTPRFL